jgi:hypothetical protein
MSDNKKQMMQRIEDLEATVSAQYQYILELEVRSDTPFAPYNNTVTIPLQKKISFLEHDEQSEDMPHEATENADDINGENSMKASVIGKSQARRETRKDGANPSEANGLLPEGAVKALVDIVRSRSLIRDDKEAEEAWARLLQVFSKFDPDRDHAVVPRDFCLAISVLMDGQGPVFSKQEWEEIIRFFQRDVGPQHAGMVNYLSFMNMVVDMSTHLQHKQKTKPPTGQIESGNNQHQPVKSKSNNDTWAVPRVPSTSPDRNRVQSATARTSSQPAHLSQSRRCSGDIATSVLSPQSKSKPMRRPRSAAPPSPKSPLAASASTSSALAYTPKVGSTGLTAVVTLSGIKKFNVSYAPQEFSNEYYEEDEADYNLCSTISGRGVVGSSFEDLSKRNRRTRVNVPRTQQIRVEGSGSYWGGTAAGSFSGSGLLAGGSVSVASGAVTSGAPVTRSQFLSRFDPVAVKALNAELGDLLSDRISKTPGVSMKELLLQYLHAEDKNRSHTLKTHSIKAALQALGVQYHFLATPGQKEILKTLLKFGKNGEIYVKDFMKLILLP